MSAEPIQPICYDIPLGQHRQAQLVLPRDLNTADAERLKKLIASLVTGSAMDTLTISAKPLNWYLDGNADWRDTDHGFSIYIDDDDGGYSAAWGEDDPEGFTTLEAAQAWCQEQIDKYISMYALVTGAP